MPDTVSPAQHNGAWNEVDSQPLRPVMHLPMIAFIVCSLVLDEAAVRADPGLARPQRMLPGEFETQDAILIGWQAKDPIIRQVLISIVSIAATNVPVLVLADDAFEQRDAVQALSLSGIAPKSIHILTVPCDTIWVRDFGPIAVTTSAGPPQIIDLEYAGKRRRKDDHVPQRVAQFLRMRAIPAGLSLEGGNLLSNGRGSLLSTSRILDQNFDRGLGYRDVTQRLQHLYGCRTPILLEPLQGEPTGHIDMFA
ncbi:MAG: agmatine deiminase family protein, partial [Planctomycetaceae bacterium]